VADEDKEDKIFYPPVVTASTVPEKIRRIPIITDHAPKKCYDLERKYEKVLRKVPGFKSGYFWISIALATGSLVPGVNLGIYGWWIAWTATLLLPVQTGLKLLSFFGKEAGNRIADPETFEELEESVHELLSQSNSLSNVNEGLLGRLETAARKRLEENEKSQSKLQASKKKTELEDEATILEFRLDRILKHHNRLQHVTDLVRELDGTVKDAAANQRKTNEVVQENKHALTNARLELVTMQRATLNFERNLAKLEKNLKAQQKTVTGNS
jgi:hypothetical protein